MTREELLERICPTDANYDCAKGKHGMSCDKCDELLNKWLNEYDEESFIGATNWARELIKEFVMNWNKQSHKRIPKLAAEELDEHIMQRRYFRLQSLRGNNQD